MEIGFFFLESQTMEKAEYDAMIFLLLLLLLLLLFCSYSNFEILKSMHAKVLEQ